MTGSSFIYSPVGCHIFQDKPRTITFNAKIFLGNNYQGTTCVIMAILHYYVPSSNPDPEDGIIYLAGRKLTDSTVVGDDYVGLTYEAVIDATFICIPNYHSIQLFTFSCSVS
jgi:hypothetical protein